MCIIIRNETGTAISESIVDNCVAINSDGFGIVYLDGKGGEFRTLDMEVARRLLATETRPYVAHCRYTTVGETIADNCHPFPIGKHRYLFHNGTISVENKVESDTAQIASMLHGMSDKRVAFILTALDHCRWAVVDTKKQSSKLFGEWHTDNGVDYSKDNVLNQQYSPCQWGYDDSNYSDWAFGHQSDNDNGASVDKSKRFTVAVYGTLRYSFSNHGLIKDSDFIGYGYTRNKMRLCINGLPYMIRGKHKSGHNVEVEVYSVDQETLNNLDALEGHPDFYKRDKISIDLDRLDGNTGTITAYVYMVGNEYDSGVYHRTF